MALASDTPIEIFKGDSSDVFGIKVDTSITSDGNCVCRLAVMPKLGNTPIILKELDLATTGTEFTGFIDPDESDQLEVGSYFLVFEIHNPVKKFRREKHFKLKVLQQGVV